MLGSSAGSIIGTYLVARAPPTTTYGFFCNHLTTSRQKVRGAVRGLGPGQRRTSRGGTRPPASGLRLDTAPMCARERRREGRRQRREASMCARVPARAEAHETPLKGSGWLRAGSEGLGGMHAGAAVARRACVSRLRGIRALDGACAVSEPASCRRRRRRRQTNQNIQRALSRSPPRAAAARQTRIYSVRCLGTRAAQSAWRGAGLGTRILAPDAVRGPASRGPSPPPGPPRRSSWPGRA